MDDGTDDGMDDETEGWIDGWKASFHPRRPLLYIRIGFLVRGLLK